MRKLITILMCSFFANNVFAEECASLQANKDAAAGAYLFKQHAFSDGKTDLVIEQQTSNAPAEIRRVTFNRGLASPACYFKPLAFAQGGDWGWHMLWGEPAGLFYARMDGEAWVSSTPKRLTKLQAINPQFKLENQTITITWQQTENGVTANMQAASSDEGRSWDVSER